MKPKKLQILIKNISAMIMQFFLALVGGFFKEPRLFALGILGVVTFIGITLSILEDYEKKLDITLTLAELLSALIAYFFYVKKNIVAWEQRNKLRRIVELKLETVRGKLEKFGFPFTWSIVDVKNITNTLFPSWIKDEEFDRIESQFVDSIDRSILKGTGLTEGKRLFLQYVIYELFPMSRSTLLSKVALSDFAPGTAANEFAYLLNSAVTNPTNFELDSIINDLELDEAKSIFSKLSSGNIAYFREKLKNPVDRKALVAIAEQCIRMGYTSIEQVLKFRREHQPFKMLIKYDERFTYFDRSLKSSAEEIYDGKKVTTLIEKVNEILNPLPFSQALNEYNNVLIKLMPRDHFVFLFDINKLKTEFGKKDPKIFMEQIVIPSAHRYHEDKMKAIRKLDRVFSKVQKKFTANYYIIDIDIETLIVEADNKSMPEGMKRILVQDVVTNGDFAQLLSTQDLYIKEIIKTMPLDALLFDADVGEPIRNYLRIGKAYIHKNLKSAKIPDDTIYEKKQFKLKINLVTDAIYGSQNKSKNNSYRLTKKEIKKTVNVISDNAAKLVAILEQGIKLN